MDQHALNAIKSWNGRQRPAYRLITVKPVNPSIGAEILGVDLSRELSPELLTEVRLKGYAFTSKVKGDRGRGIVVPIRDGRSAHCSHREANRTNNARRAT